MRRTLLLTCRARNGYLGNDFNVFYSMWSPQTLPALPLLLDLDPATASRSGRGAAGVPGDPIGDVGTITFKGEPNDTRSDLGG